MVQGRAESRPGIGALRELIITIALAGIVFLLIHTTLRNFQVEGFSMQPTLDNGQFLLVNRALYARYHIPEWAEHIPLLDRDGNGYVEPFRSPRRGEVIVFRSVEANSRNLIKRVIGLPGDTVEIRKGVVYVNDDAWDEHTYIPTPGTTTLGPVKVPADRYWVMGDNRTGSSDSRSFGPVPRDYVIGKAWFSYWPWKDLGLIHTHPPKALS